MKKVFVVVCMALATSLFTNSASAQMKIGTFDEESVLGLFPGIQQKVDSAIQKFVADSLKPDYDWTLSEMLRMDSTFNKDSGKLAPSVRTVMKKEINEKKYKIANWQQYQNQALQGKQEEVLYPYKQKMYEALEKIIREQKYTHVFKSDVLLIAPPSDNLAIKVAVALKLKLPKEVEESLKAQGVDTGTPSGGATKPAGTAKPATKPAPKN